jgi:hypothetical protein
MKKIFVISLLLVSAFIIGSSEMAAAQCQDYQDYECTYTVYQYGQTDYIDFDYCIRLCFDDGFEVYATDYDWFDGWLYPATGSKNLLGTAHTGEGWAGFSMDFKGRSMTYRFSFIQGDAGYTETAKCTPSNNCVFR